MPLSADEFVVPPLTDQAKALIAQRVNVERWGHPKPSLMDKMLKWLRKKTDDAQSQW